MHTDWVNTITLTADESKLFSGSSDRTLKLTNVQTGQTGWRCLPVAKPTVSVATAASLHALQDCRIMLMHMHFRVWYIQIPTVQLWPSHVMSCHVMSLRMPGPGDVLMTYIGHSGGVFGCRLSKDERRLLSLSFDKTMIMWTVQTGDNWTMQPATTGHA